jgi:hypothetical protein
LFVSNAVNTFYKNHWEKKSCLFSLYSISSHEIKVLTFSVAQQPNSGLGRPILRFLDHTQLEDTPYTIHLNVRSARRRGRYLPNTQQTQEPKTHALSGTEPVITAVEWPKTYDSDRTPTGIGQPSFTMFSVNQKVKCVLIFYETILYFVVIRMEALELFTPGKTKDVTRRFLGVFARRLRKRILAFVMSCQVCLSAIYILPSIR